jgi:tetratricopeptide (TPR) repeat protein
MSFRRVVGAGPVVLACTLIGLLACGPSAFEKEAVRSTKPEYVGGDVCTPCHEGAAELWSRSHHDLAMQEATSATILGDFDDASFTYGGTTSTFFERDGRFLVRTDGPDGELEDYEIAYAFGVAPLQQYLVEFPGGRLQALNICWDTRPASAGGQRWFHLYPDEEITFDDPLHWTGAMQNWNYMCAECHSTKLEKNYLAAEDRYETAWSEIDVACEACHGPGSEHVAWARSSTEATERPEVEHFALAVRLEDPGRGTWVIDPETDLGMRLEPAVETWEIETCARCHSRRTSITGDYVHGRPIADTHRVSLLDEQLYHADGQVLDEVYVYGSYLQSKMYQAGVTCSDCHDPHGLNLKFSGNGVCARCHTAAKFDAKDHHFHEPGTEGSLCVDCHMPPTNYMVIDARHDHSMRVPRPDLSLTIGTPNACNGCHQDESVEWAVDNVAEWYGPDRRGEPRFGEVIYAGRTGQADAESRLVALLADGEAPAIVRATAAQLLSTYLSPGSLGAVQAALADSEPLVRRAAVATLAVVDPATRASLVSPLLKDPVKTVRMQAAQVLATVSGEAGSGVPPAALRAALTEYEDAQRFNADRAENRLNLGWLHTQRRELGEAESEYLKALEMAPWLAPAYVNLADLYRNQSRESEGEELLRQGLDRAADPAALHHALGLLLVRGQRLPEAIDELQRAAELRSDEPRYAYVYGVGLHSAGRVDEALAVLGRAHQVVPADREILVALVTMNQEAGNVTEALKHARRLLELSPDDQSVRQVVAQLEEQMD